MGDAPHYLEKYGTEQVVVDGGLLVRRSRQSRDRPNRGIADSIVNASSAALETPKRASAGRRGRTTSAARAQDRRAYRSVSRSSRGSVDSINTNRSEMFAGGRAIAGSSASSTGDASSVRRRAGMSTRARTAYERSIKRLRYRSRDTRGMIMRDSYELQSGVPPNSARSARSVQRGRADSLVGRPGSADSASGRGTRRRPRGGNGGPPSATSASSAASPRAHSVDGSSRGRLRGRGSAAPSNALRLPSEEKPTALEGASGKEGTRQRAASSSRSVSSDWGGRAPRSRWERNRGAPSARRHRTGTGAHASSELAADSEASVSGIERDGVSQMRRGHRRARSASDVVGLRAVDILLSTPVHAGSPRPLDSADTGSAGAAAALSAAADSGEIGASETESIPQSKQGDALAGQGQHAARPTPVIIAGQFRPWLWSLPRLDGVSVRSGPQEPERGGRSRRSVGAVGYDAMREGVATSFVGRFQSTLPVSLRIDVIARTAAAAGDSSDYGAPSSLAVVQLPHIMPRLSPRYVRTGLWTRFGKWIMRQWVPALLAPCRIDKSQGAGVRQALAQGEQLANGVLRACCTRLQALFAGADGSVSGGGSSAVARPGLHRMKTAQLWMRWTSINGVQGKSAMKADLVGIWQAAVVHVAQGMHAAGAQSAADVGVVRLTDGVLCTRQLLQTCNAVFGQGIGSSEIEEHSTGGKMVASADNMVALVCLAVLAVLGVGADRHLFEIGAAAIEDERDFEAETPKAPWRTAAVIRSIRGRLLAGAANSLGLCMLSYSGIDALAPHPRHAEASAKTAGGRSGKTGGISRKLLAERAKSKKHQLQARNQIASANDAPATALLAHKLGIHRFGKPRRSSIDYVTASGPDPGRRVHTGARDQLQRELPGNSGAATTPVKPPEVPQLVMAKLSPGRLAAEARPERSMHHNTSDTASTGYPESKHQSLYNDQTAGLAASAGTHPASLAIAGGVAAAALPPARQAGASGTTCEQAIPGELEIGDADKQHVKSSSRAKPASEVLASDNRPVQSRSAEVTSTDNPPDESANQDQSIGETSENGGIRQSKSTADKPSSTVSETKPPPGMSKARAGVVRSAAWARLYKLKQAAYRNRKDGGVYPPFVPPQPMKLTQPTVVPVVEKENGSAVSSSAVDKKSGDGNGVGSSTTSSVRNSSTPASQKVPVEAAYDGESVLDLEEAAREPSSSEPARANPVANGTALKAAVVYLAQPAIQAKGEAQHISKLTVPLSISKPQVVIPTTKAGWQVSNLVDYALVSPGAAGPASRETSGGIQSLISESELQYVVRPGGVYLIEGFSSDEPRGRMAGARGWEDGSTDSDLDGGEAKPVNIEGPSGAIEEEFVPIASNDSTKPKERTSGGAQRFTASVSVNATNVPGRAPSRARASKWATSTATTTSKVPGGPIPHPPEVGSTGIAGRPPRAKRRVSFVDTRQDDAEKSNTEADGVDSPTAGGASGVRSTTPLDMDDVTGIGRTPQDDYLPENDRPDKSSSSTRPRGSSGDDEVPAAAEEGKDAQDQANVPRHTKDVPGPGPTAQSAGRRKRRGHAGATPQLLDRTKAVDVAVGSAAAASNSVEADTTEASKQPGDKPRQAMTSEVLQEHKVEFTGPAGVATDDAQADVLTRRRGKRGQQHAMDQDAAEEPRAAAPKSASPSLSPRSPTRSAHLEPMPLPPAASFDGGNGAGGSGLPDTTTAQAKSRSSRDSAQESKAGEPQPPVPTGGGVERAAPATGHVPETSPRDIQRASEQRPQSKTPLPVAFPAARERGMSQQDPLEEHAKQEAGRGHGDGNRVKAKHAGPSSATADPLDQGTRDYGTRDGVYVRGYIAGVARLAGGASGGSRVKRRDDPAGEYKRAGRERGEAEQKEQPLPEGGLDADHGGGGRAGLKERGGQARRRTQRDGQLAGRGLGRGPREIPLDLPIEVRERRMCDEWLEVEAESEAWLEYEKAESVASSVVNGPRWALIV